MFNAGNDWQDAIASDAVASFAATAERLFNEMPERLEGAASAAAAVGDILSDARAASQNVGFSPAAFVAERALARLILGNLAGATAASDATENWLANRGSTPGEAVARYLGEVLGQYARHVSDREAGRLAEREIGATASASLSNELAIRAQSLALEAYRPAATTDQSVAGRWGLLVSAAFEAGRVLPGRPR